jgi:hypothetical protein
VKNEYFPAINIARAILVFDNYSRHKELLGYIEMLASAAGVKWRMSRYTYQQKQDTGERSIKTITREDKRIR